MMSHWTCLFSALLTMQRQAACEVMWIMHADVLRLSTYSSLESTLICMPQITLSCDLMGCAHTALLTAWLACICSHHAVNT